MRAGLTTRCLTFRDTFVCTPTSSLMAFADTGRQLTLAFKHGVATLDGVSTAQTGFGEHQVVVYVVELFRTQAFRI